jgi:hypothetical protein
MLSLCGYERNYLSRKKYILTIAYGGYTLLSERIRYHEMIHEMSDEIIKDMPCEQIELISMFFRKVLEKLSDFDVFQNVS